LLVICCCLLPHALASAPRSYESPTNHPRLGHICCSWHPFSACRVSVVSSSYAPVLDRLVGDKTLGPGPSVRCGWVLAILPKLDGKKLLCAPVSLGTHGSQTLRPSRQCLSALDGPGISSGLSLPLSRFSNLFACGTADPFQKPCKWRQRLIEHSLAGLHDKSRLRRPRSRTKAVSP